MEKFLEEKIEELIKNQICLVFFVTIGLGKVIKMIDEIKKLKKVELHLHLDGSVKIETACELAGVSIDDAKKEMVAQDKCRDLTEYLTKFDLPISIMQEKEN